MFSGKKIPYSGPLHAGMRMGVRLRPRHISAFRNWKDHDACKGAFDRLLRDLKAVKVGSADFRFSESLRHFPSHADARSSPSAE